MQKRSRAVVVCLIGTTLLSCGGGGEGPAAPAPVLTTLGISFPTSTIQAGQSATVTVAGLDQFGASIGTGTVSWSTAATTVATVDANGVVTGVAAGTTEVIAAAGGTQAQTPVFVIPVPVASVTVSPPTAALVVGTTQQMVATMLDANGNALSGRVESWGTSDFTKATVSSTGLVTAMAAGTTTITATSESRAGTSQITVTNVIPVPVASVTVSPPTATLFVGTTQQMVATTLDANGNALSGRFVSWGSSDFTKATVTSTGLVTAMAAGTTTITATSESRSGTSQITVVSSQSICNSTTALQLAVGAGRTLTPAETASLCLGGGASASEYVLIPFNSTNVAASTIQLQITGTNTSAIQPGPLASLQLARANAGLRKASPAESFEWSFRERERRDIGSAFASSRQPRRAASAGFTPRNLTSLPANPTVGTIVPINSSISGNTCTDPKQLHGAVVVAVLPHTIVLSDTLSPPGGYTSAEMTAFGQAFEADGYPLDVLNFGAETDFDGNGRIAILFTPGVNVIPGPPGGFIGGLFAGRDLVSAAICVGSNEGEMFYMPVPDPNRTINGNYTVKADLARLVLSVLVHEFQHLINGGRRIVNGSPYEEVWLNEGLSHVAEELLYYRMSGNSPRSNIDLPLLQSSQAQLDAMNAYQIQNLLRLSRYMSSPETNSPISQTGSIEMRGAIWQLLRYAADRKGGTEQNTWSALVNSTQAGQANFNAVFGDIITMSRDWAVAQFVDDAGLNLSPNYANPSWQFRSIMPSINGGNFPLFTRPLLSAPVDITLNGGGAAYVRFRVAASVPATIGAASSGQAVPSAVDFMLIRTQ